MGPEGGLGFGIAGDFEWECDVFEDGSLGEEVEVLEDHADLLAYFEEFFWGDLG